MADHKPIFPSVSVDGTTIPETAIASEAQMHRAPKGKPGLAWRAAARALVLRKLLLDEAARQGLAPDPLEVAPGKFETEDEALIRQLLEAELTLARPTEDEVRAYWQADPARFRSPPLRQASHILFAAKPGDMAALATARARALAAQAELATNPARFAALASQISDCPSKANGGALGQLRPGDMVPEFDAALDGLTAGQIAPDPVKTRFGLHLVRLDELAEGRELPFDAVRPHLTEAMEKQAWAVAARDYALRLAAKATIEGVDLGVAA